MAVLPSDICQCLGHCDAGFGCIVVFHISWLASCMLDPISCKEMARPDIACIWDGVQTGGKILTIFNKIRMLKIFYYNRWWSTSLHHYHNIHLNNNNLHHYKLYNHYKLFHYNQPSYSESWFIILRGLGLWCAEVLSVHRNSFDVISVYFKFFQI